MSPGPGFSHHWEAPEAEVAAPRPPAGPATPPKLRLSVVTCAYNEAQNLPYFLPAVLGSAGPSFELVELIAVASGCTDRTVEILRTEAARDRRVRVIVQAERLGKVAATAAGFAAARGDVILLANSDTVPRRGAVEELARPFADPSVDLVCSHPVPAIGPETMTARVGRILWDLHDRVSATSPKVGEAFALRRTPIPLGPGVADDDSFIGAFARSKGWGVRYARSAIVYNRVPSFPREYLRQRVRINRHLLGVYKNTGVRSSTWSPKLLVRALLEYGREHPREVLPMALLCAAEIVARTGAVAVGAWSSAPVSSWRPIDSTKWAIDRGGA